MLDVARTGSRGFAGAGNDVAIGIARVILYCETVFVTTGYPAHRPIVKRPASGIGRPAAAPTIESAIANAGTLTPCPPLRALDVAGPEPGPMDHRRELPREGRPPPQRYRDRRGVWVRGSALAALACPGRRAFRIQISNTSIRVRVLAAPRCPRLSGASSLQRWREQGDPGCALHPRVSCANAHKQAHTSIQVQRRQSDIPCAMALRLMPRSPRRIGLCLSPSPAGWLGSSAPGRADLPSADFDANR